MKRLGNTVGDRINEFDNFDTQTVGTFNNLFPECPIDKFSPLATVEILDPTANNSRYLRVNEEVIVHKMFSDLMYNVNRDEYNTRDLEEELDDIMGHPV